MIWHAGNWRQYEDSLTAQGEPVIYRITDRHQEAPKHLRSAFTCSTLDVIQGGLEQQAHEQREPVKAPRPGQGKQ